MDLIRTAVGDAWTAEGKSSDTMKNMTRQVSDAEWQTMDKEFYNTEGGYLIVETSSADMAKIEELLGVEKGFFASPVMIKTSQRCCANCNRENNFLDVVATGLKVHKPEFLVDVFTGKYGRVLNTQQDQRCFCFECKTLLPKSAAKYSTPKVPEKMFYGWSWPF